MEGNSPRTTSERCQRVRVQSQRQDERTVGGLTRRQRRHDESPPGRRRRRALTYRYRPAAQRSTAEEDAEPSRRKIDPDEVGTAPGIKLRGSCAAGIDPAGGTIRPAGEQHALPARAALYDWHPSRTTEFGRWQHGDRGLARAGIDNPRRQWMHNKSAAHAKWCRIAGRRRNTGKGGSARQLRQLRRGNLNWLHGPGAWHRGARRCTRTAGGDRGYRGSRHHREHRSGGDGARQGADPATAEVQQAPTRSSQPTVSSQCLSPSPAGRSAPASGLGRAVPKRLGWGSGLPRTTSQAS